MMGPQRCRVLVRSSAHLLGVNFRSFDCFPPADGVHRRSITVGNNPRTSERPERLERTVLVCLLAFPQDGSNQHGEEFIISAQACHIRFAFIRRDG